MSLAKIILHSHFFAASGLPELSNVSYINALSLHDAHATHNANIISAITNCGNVVLIPYENIPIVASIDETTNERFLPRLSLMYQVGISLITRAIEKMDWRSVMCERDNQCCEKNSAIVGIKNDMFLSSFIAANLYVFFCRQCVGGGLGESMCDYNRW
jgi:hypothetical protein